MKRVAMILAAGAFLAGCASAPVDRFSLVPIKSNGADLSGVDASTTLESRQPGGIVSVRSDPDFSDFGATLLVAVQNKSTGPVEFGPANIEASAGGKKLAVLGAAELDARAQAKLAGLVRASNRTGTTGIDKATVSAQREYQYETFGGNAAGQGGGASCVLASADNCSSYRADRENRRADADLMAKAAMDYKRTQVALRKTLRPSTVAPNQMAGGAVVIQPPEAAGPIDITVTFSGQKHKFTFLAKAVAP